MTEFTGAPVSVNIPDNLTLVQFILDEPHVLRPVRPQNAPWMIDDETGREVGFEQIRTRVHGLANSLSLDFQLRDDDVVCIFSPNHVDYPTVIWAAHRLGAAASPANPAYTASELAYQLTTSRSSLLFAHVAFVDVARKAAREAGLAPERLVLIDGKGRDGLEALIQRGLRVERVYEERKLAKGEGKTKIAFLSFSSGTTGKPKAVAISHYAPIANVIQLNLHAGASADPAAGRFAPGDVALGALPFYHIFGLVVVLHFNLFSGLPVVVMPKFNFEGMLRSVERFRIKHLFVVPPMVVLLVKHPAAKKADLSHVKSVVSGAAPLSGELVAQLSRVIPDASISQGYGMTETSTVVTFIPQGVKIAAPGSSGQLLPGVRARVIKEDGTRAKVGERGELIVTGPSMALSYANNAEATAETFIDGWVRTGDEVFIDEKNELFVTDRIKELIKVRGFQVAPAELEGHLLGHPDIADVCVVGVPDEYSGEVPLAFVVLNAGAQARVKGNAGETARAKASVAKHVADHKVAYKKLAGGVEFVEAIPKNPSGKLLRRVLRDKARAMRAKVVAPAQARL